MVGKTISMGSFGNNVRTIWISLEINMVGILLGYHGACYLLCYLWHNYTLLHLHFAHWTSKITLNACLFMSKEDFESKILFCTFQEFILPSALDRRYLTIFHKKARKAGLDLVRYNDLKDEAFELNTMLKLLHGPLHEHKCRIEEKRKRCRRSSSSSSSESRSPSPSLSEDQAAKKGLFSVLKDSVINKFKTNAKKWFANYCQTWVGNGLMEKTKL